MVMLACPSCNHVFDSMQGRLKNKTSVYMAGKSSSKGNSLLNCIYRYFCHSIRLRIKDIVNHFLEQLGVANF
ncbi:hypothetical protein J2S08_000616 [Bacillus chungangensis]|uniref:Uncharacterized protein n=1 Tax=Bacillus chungangensis TaxID=587633 RepID=A0ABT9WNR1_9BACI|nr:hypothetical protein [Bacillus chungangensis]